VALFIRFFVVMFALCLGSIAAGATYFAAANSFGGQFEQSYNDYFYWVFIFAALTCSTIFFFWSYIPIFIAVLITEAFSIRSALIYAVAGAAGGGFYGYSLLANIPHGIQSAAAGGIVGALVYWLFAGRNAGRWREIPGGAVEKV
jgi:hypothetical protein